MEDKNPDEKFVSNNAEARLIAEAISAQQSNSLKDESQPTKKCRAPVEDSIAGIRVCGCCFTFYSISISKHLLDDVVNESVASEKTYVRRFRQSPGSGYDFRIPEDIIISVLKLFAASVQKRWAAGEA